MNQPKTANQNKRKRKWPWALGITLAVIALVFAAVSRRTASSGHTIRSAAAETGRLSMTVVGTGNLEYDDAVDIKIPSGITIDEVLAESGDRVSAGDTLAVVNALSLKQEIESVRSRINALDRSINSAKDGPETETVKANVDGRVKRIYAQKGDDALDVYFENGALLLLSLDEKMAVDFETAAALSIGEKVDVVLENGGAKEGTVEKADGRYTVTLTDNGPGLDEPVTVQSKNGDVLGTGTLYIHQPIKIVAAYGKVGTIHVSENEKVSSGKTLVTLEDLPASADYGQLLADRAELLDKLDKLLALSKTNTLAADFDGVIMSVNLEEGKTADGSGASGSTSGSAASGSSGAYPAAASASSAAQTSSGDSDETMVTAFTAAPAESVVLSVNVDELDILSIQNGMEVEITFDAISDRTFGGKIVKIADSATAGGGVAKYPVKVRIPKDDAMRVGMNATATILVEEKENILLLPVVALQESGGRVYVYTRQNAETGELSGEVDVKTGSSDGENVEIVSGLSEGSEVYYKAASGETLMGFGMGGGFRSGSGFGGGSEDQE